VIPSTRPRALVLRAPGINCDRETAHACRLVGFATDLLHINQLIKDPPRLLDYHFLVIPGGFSYGDDLGAGTLLAKNLTIHLGKQLEQFINDGRLILGICNGFQALVRAGLLPGRINDESYNATLTDNASAQFECRWVTLTTLPGHCIFTHGIAHPIQLPVAHGEGQFIMSDDITYLLAYHQVPLLYTLPTGDPATNHTLSGGALPYPYNPNGSLENVAGICNARGNVMGMMPHPERYVSALQHPQRKGLPDGAGDGLLIFKNAYEYALQHVEASPQHVAAQFIAPVGADSSRPLADLSRPYQSRRNELRRHTHIDQSAYSASGVDIDAAERAKELMKEAVRSTHGSNVLAGMGAFAGMIDIEDIQRMRRPALVASTDGVGTKTLLAAQAGRYDTIGYDLVHHSVNDLLTQGARPLFFMDYLAMGKLDPEQAAGIVRGVADACRGVGCALLGGETAEMPDVYLPGAFDLVGTIIGVVEQDSIIDSGAIRPGDVLLGLPSSGLHTNGYSLARNIFARYPYETVFPELGEPLIDALLRPHRCYLREIRALQEATIALKGIAHITGGGFQGNIARILPAGKQAEIDPSLWDIPPLFTLIARLGKVNRDEMFHTFNMGVGMVLVCAADQIEQARSIVPELLYVGQVTAGNGVTIL
jgi:phosphoribosylformylglycinamidine synthase I